MQLAGGRNDVQIPYQGPGDEVGDAARAANIFKDNLLRMQDLEAEKKRAVAEAALTRREQTHRLADEFEQAVGAIVKAVSRATGELQGTAKSLTETADLTHQRHCRGVGILIEGHQRIPGGGADNGIAADADEGRDAQARQCLGPPRGRRAGRRYCAAR